MAGAYGFMANADIEIPLTGGARLTLSPSDFVVFGNVDTLTSVGYIYHFKSIRPQDVQKSEVIASELEPLLRGWQASKAIIGFDTKESFEAALIADQNAHAETEAKAAEVKDATEETSKGKKIKQTTETEGKKTKRKENLPLCFAVAGLICLGIYLVTKK